MNKNDACCWSFTEISVETTAKQHFMVTITSLLNKNAFAVAWRESRICSTVQNLICPLRSRLLSWHIHVHEHICMYVHFVVCMYVHIVLYCMYCNYKTCPDEIYKAFRFMLSVTIWNKHLPCSTHTNFRRKIGWYTYLPYFVTISWIFNLKLYDWKYPGRVFNGLRSNDYSDVSLLDKRNHSIPFSDFFISAKLWIRGKTKWNSW